jgi:hypothetical protein
MNPLASARGPRRSALRPRWCGVRGADRAGGDQGRAVAREAGDAVDARRPDGLGEGHRRQDGGEPPGQYRLARPGGPMRTLWAERLHPLS